MRTLSKSALALAAALALTACGGKAKPASTTPDVAPAPAPAPAPAATKPEPGSYASRPVADADVDALMGQAVAMFAAMGDAADQAGGDCGKLAAALEQIMGDHEAFIAEAKAWNGNAEMDRRGEEWMNSHQDEVMGPMMKVAGEGQKCASDPAFMAAMEKLSAVGQ